MDDGGGRENPETKGKEKGVSLTLPEVIFASDHGREALIEDSKRDVRVLGLESDLSCLLNLVS